MNDASLTMHQSIHELYPKLFFIAAGSVRWPQEIPCAPYGFRGTLKIHMKPHKNIPTSWGIGAPRHMHIVVSFIISFLMLVCVEGSHSKCEKVSDLRQAPRNPSAGSFAWESSSESCLTKRSRAQTKKPKGKIGERF